MSPLSSPDRSLAAAAAAVRGTLLDSHAADLTFTSASIDSRTLTAGQIFFAIRGPRYDGHAFLDAAAERGAIAAVVAEAPPQAPRNLALIRVDDTTQALNSLAASVRRGWGGPLVAVTGSTGKTTTKDMTARILETQGRVLRTEGNLNNQYGLPLTLLRLERSHHFAVVELGMSAPGELYALSRTAAPDVAIITNVGAAHLEFFASEDAIAAAKAEILDGLRASGHAVLNRDDSRLVRIGEKSGRSVVWFGLGRDADVSATSLIHSERGTKFTLGVRGKTATVELAMFGPHFVSDFLAATAAASCLGVGMEDAIRAASTLVPTDRRGAVRHLGAGVRLVDDSYNASPEAVAAAIGALGLVGGKRRVAFLGDMLELGGRGAELHRALGASLAAHVDVLVAAGDLSRQTFVGALAGGLEPSCVRHVADSAEAAKLAAQIVQPGDVVLVKGSRATRMERVSEALVANFGEANA